MRIVLGVVAGLALAFVCIMAIELLGHTLFPPPPDLDISDPADMARLMQEIPTAALAFVWVSWFVGALLGAGLANRIARNPAAGWIVAAMVVVGGVLSMLMIPHPAWMWAAAILLPLLAAWLAGRITRGGAQPMS